MIIRGGDRGGLDGVDIWGSNIWAHDIEVSNRDEWLVLPVMDSTCSGLTSGYEASLSRWVSRRRPARTR